MKEREIKKLLETHAFGELFNQIGWDWPESDAAHPVQIGSTRFELRPVGHKRGFMAYHCPHMPDAATRAKIETRLARDVREHLIIFTAPDTQEQRWHWVRRAPGQPLARREHPYLPNQPRLLIDKIRWLEVRMDEEENLIITDVADKVQSALDVDRVTKRFYDRFKKEHDAFLVFIEGIADMGDAKWYASVMLNRLMFIYFIQKKGFLDGDKNYLRNRLASVQALKGKDRFLTFYRYFLLTLCHEVLAKKDRDIDKELAALIGDVPYLNGGIFQPHEIEKKYGEGIHITDAAFQQVFDFFDQYEWHLDNRAAGSPNEINPDVLGYIFEKYINQKQMGAYYTKEDITEYISKNTIIPCLFDKARTACKIAFEGNASVWNLLKADPDRYIYPAIRHGVTYDVYRDIELTEPFPIPPEIAAGLDTTQPVLIERRKDWNKATPPEAGLPTEIWRETIARRQRYTEVRGKLERGEVRNINDLITLNLDSRQFAQDVIEQAESPDLVNAFWVAIAGRIPEKANGEIKIGISVLDPTCGSGAFLFAALNILEPLYEACLKRMETFLQEWGSQPKHKNYAAFFQSVLDDIKKHPTPQYFIYKSIIVQNLYGVDLMKEAVEICKLRLFLKLVAQVDDGARIEPLPDIDFNIRAGNTLVGYATRTQMEDALRSDLLAYSTVLPEILEQAEGCDRLFNVFRQAQLDNDTTLPQAKAQLSGQLKALNARLNQYLAQDYKVDPKKTLAYDAFLKSHQPFHWFIEFYGIMHTGGFDVIIGNPPYLEIPKLRGLYRVHGFATEPCGNLYALVVERSIAISRFEGRLGVIVPIGSASLAETQTFRECLSKYLLTLYAAHFAIRPAKLFNGVEQRLTIYMGQTHLSEGRAIYSSKYHQWFVDERDALFSCVRYAPPPESHLSNIIVKTGTPLVSSILGKVNAHRSVPITRLLTERGENLLFFHRTPGYWVRVMDFLPYFHSPQGDRSIHHIREIHCKETLHAGAIGAIVSSSLYFLWLFASGNCRNLTLDDVHQFPLGALSNGTQEGLTSLFKSLMDDFRANSFTAHRGESEFQQFRWDKSKPIIDEIDRVLAKHYGFTDEELDFIINYDIKYRMGGADNDEDVA